MPPEKIEALVMALKENINDLIHKHPHFKKDLNKMIVRSESMSENQLLILTQRLEDFLQIDESYFAWKNQNEWMLQIEPKCNPPL